MKSLFPMRPILFVAKREGEQCPFCGENRVTDDIHGFITYLCGASKCLNDETPCEGSRYIPFVEYLSCTE